MSRSDSLLCFTHVQKAGGTTVEAVMRRHFGIRHMVVDPAHGWLYREKDLATDLRINPWLQNLCSHWLRPFASFGRFHDRMVWYTMLREPIARYLSHYQHHVEHWNKKKKFEKFLTRKRQRDWQTRLIAGEPDVEAAKQILASRYRGVGVLERFDESLLLLRRARDRPGLQLNYGRVLHAASSSQMRTDLLQRMENHRDACMENNRLDLELYDFVVREIFPKQVRTYGEERLRADLAEEFTPRADTLGERAREMSNMAYRRAVYLPMLRIRRQYGNAPAVPARKR